MAQHTRLYWIHVISPLHVGSGRGAGYVDLPIMREKVTGWPLVPGSAVKGVLADHHQATDKERESNPALRAAFGRGGEEHSSSGSLVFSDARIVCLPVRSLYGTFAWCTPPAALRRLRRDFEMAGAGVADLPADLSVREDGALLPDGTASVLVHDNRLYLEDLDFKTKTSPEAAAWASRLAGWVFPGDDTWKTAFLQRFAVLPDNAFNFLSETGTEVNARVRLEDETKTVARGALWYEEALPAETLLAGIVWCDRVFGNNGVQPAELMDRFCRDATLQMGGDAPTGKGRVRLVFTKEGTDG